MFHKDHQQKRVPRKSRNSSTDMGPCVWFGFIISKIIPTRGEQNVYIDMLFFASPLLVSRRFCKGCSFSSPPKARRCGLQGRTSKPQRLEGCAAGFRVSRSQVRLGNHHTQKTKTKLKPEIARLLSINSRHRRTSLQSQTPDRLTPVARPL